MMQRDEDRGAESLDLSVERERLRITLASIGDAVISTDAEGRVTFMNAVAERLTGWSLAEAEGRPLLDIFCIVNEHTRRPVENPAIRALRDGVTVGLANHTVLIARDGSERPIDDSAAPIRDGSGEPLGSVLVFRDVSERKRAEEARARLAAIVDSSDDAIISKTLDGVIRTWNAGARRLFGYTAEEAVGQSITLIIPPERQDEEREILGRLVRGEHIKHFETVRVAKDGRRLDISLTISPLRDPAGHITGASKIARDITERQRADRALRASEGRHRFLLDLAAATRLSTDPAEIMAISARMLAEHLDVDRCAYAEVEDESIYVITGDHARGVPSIVGRWPIASFGAGHLRCMLANEPYVVDDVADEPRAGADKSAYEATTIQAVICVPLHKAGKLVAAMAVHQSRPRHWSPEEVELVRTMVIRSWESIERARVSRGLQDTADRLALALAAANLGDWSWDAATDLVDLSARAAEIFGLPASAPPMTWAQLQGRIHPADREWARVRVEQSIASCAPYDIEYRVQRAEGDVIWVSARGHVRCDPADRRIGMYGVVQDISEAKQFEQELHARAEQLALADRKKDDFIALLAHELRNPLAPIRHGLQVMRLAGGDASVIARTRDMMDRQLGHMVRLIDDLLDVSRLTRNRLVLQRTRVQLTEVISHAVEIARPAIEAAGHVLTVALPDEPVFLHADLTRLAQVFGNLLANSVKYTGRGGHIHLAAERQGQEIVVSVRDDGIGIPGSALPFIFEMFSQADESRERSAGGLGIGLALVKGVTEMHGGSVTATSEGHGKGSTFAVRLPAMDSAQEPAVSASADGQARPGARRRVLVADDNVDAADMITLMLGNLGDEVATAHDGLEALAVAETFRPEFVLLDIGMPRLNGYEVARRLRERPWARAIRIVALTGWGQEKDRAQSRAAGCDDHLVKPVSLAELERLIHT
jgi:PAS domain S-box-containing protein